LHEASDQGHIGAKYLLADAYLWGRGTVRNKFKYMDLRVKADKLKKELNERMTKEC